MTSSEPAQRFGRGRFPWLLVLISLPLIAALLWLGLWQVQRLEWKSALIEDAERAEQAPPVPLAALLASGERPGFRRVIVRCPGLAGAPYVELQSIHESEAGVRLISVCRPEGVQGVWLIDRGFVPGDDGPRPQVRASEAMTGFTSEFTGIIRQIDAPHALTPAPRGLRFYGRDHAAMAQALGVQGPVVRDLVILAESPVNPEVEALRPAIPPAAFSNNHLGYALTWFGLALALIFVVGLKVRQSLRK
jgi:surfeit locus 1 family protein